MSTPEVKSAAPAKPAEKLSLSAEDLQKIIQDTALSVAMAVKNAGPQQVTPAPSDGRRGLDYGPVCTICRQPEKGCHKEHVDMVVFPTRYPEFGDFFRGVILNGVVYLSSDENQAIPVPKDAATWIAGTIRNFEQNERETQHGRSKTHHSGHVARPKSAEVGWR